MNNIAKSVLINKPNGNQFKFTGVKQLYIFGNALIISGNDGANEQVTEKFFLRDLSSISVEF